MMDLIDRQAVIDALMEHFKRNTTVAIRAKLTVEGVPSAQLELIAQGAYVRGFEQGRTQGMLDAKLQQTCNQLATDTISRQAAIDAIQRYKYEHGFDFHACAMGIERDIKAVPSVQPEIVRCGQCKHYYFADNRIPQEQRYTCELDGDRWKADDFCSYAERRKDG